MSGLASLVLSVRLVAALVQGAPPELRAEVDRDRLSVGDEVVYTLRAVARSAAPARLTVAPFTGFEVLSRTERTELSYAAGGPVRTTVLDVRLRAAHAGRWQLGPARLVAQAGATEAKAIVVDVEPDRAPGTVALSAAVRRLLERAPAPPRGTPAVALLVSHDSARVGEQVDLVTAAWFPRELRLQLRRAPTLQPPVVSQVWSYPQTTPAGIAATRTVAGVVYDLFVAHQVIFPLVAGRIAIPAATLKYSVPRGLQFFNQEQRFLLSSGPAELEIASLPAEGRPPEFDGAVGAGLRLTRRITPARLRAGEPVTVELTLAGRGNLALWPAPHVEWPRTLRAYTEQIEEQVDAEGDAIGGTKTFRYLVVPDSTGVLHAPATRYAYFDLAEGRYEATGVPELRLPVGTRAEAAAAPLPPPLLHGGRPSLAWRAVHRTPSGVWAGLLLLPPLVLGLRGRWRAPVPRRRPAAEPGRPSLGRAEERLDAVLAKLAPDAGHRGGPSLVSAVRAAGGDEEMAERVADVRERLLRRRYGPGPARADDEGLAAEIDELCRRLSVEARSWARRAVGVVVLALAAGRAAAQTPSPERLYEAGALHAAAELFAERAGREPAVAAHWYNLGSTYYRLGSTGRAEAAWLRARRLAPREPAVRRALRLVPAPDAVSARWTWTAPFTPEELHVAAALGWLAGWVGWARWPRFRSRCALLLAVAAATAAAAAGLNAWYRRPVAVVLDPAALRLSPHGRAPEVAELEAGSAVLLARRTAGWVLVQSSGGRRGWLPDAVVAAVGG